MNPWSPVFFLASHYTLVVALLLGSGVLGMISSHRRSAPSDVRNFAIVTGSAVFVLLVRFTVGP